MKKRMLAVVLGMVMTVSLMAGCGAKEGSNAKEEADTYTIGISQFAEHGSLDNCREGFLDGLAEAGIVEGENLTVEYKNAAADMGTTSQIFSIFVSEKCNIICAF